MILIYLILLSFINTSIYALKPIHLTIVVCGDRYRINQVFIFFYFYFLIRLEEALTALKSSLIFTSSPIIFHIFTEDHLKEKFKEKVKRFYLISILI
jgi:hypothetical protein